ASATSSPDEIMSSPSGPSTVSTAFMSPALAALAKAVAASSGVLKACWAPATDAAVQRSVAIVSETRILFIASSFAQTLVENRSSEGNVSARRNPMLVSLELDAQLVIEAPQVAVAPADDRPRRNRQHFLRHHANIGPVAAVVAEAIEAKAVIEMAEKNDVMLERDIGSPSAAAAAATAAA